MKLGDVYDTMIEKYDSRQLQHNLYHENNHSENKNSIKMTKGPASLKSKNRTKLTTPVNKRESALPSVGNEIVLSSSKNLHNRFRSIDIKSRASSTKAMIIGGSYDMMNGNTNNSV